MIAYATTKHLYYGALNRAQRGQLWSALTRRPRHLLALAEIEDICTVKSCRYVGLRTVPIRRIRGSQGRSQDFDRDFNPLKEHTKMRWIGIAAARQAGKSLPPVELIQVGDVYFVLDGHHRISVAQALGQKDIEAEVTVWQVTGPLPWDASPTRQEREIKPLYKKIRDDSARFKEHFLLSFRKPLMAVGTRLRARMAS